MTPKELKSNLTINGWILILITFLTACQGNLSKETSVTTIPQEITETATLTPVETATSAMPTLTSTPTSLAQTASKNDLTSNKTVVAPDSELADPSATQIVIQSLANRFEAHTSDVDIVEVGLWTQEPIACTLDVADELQQPILQQEHQLVMASFKNKSYAYWVFRTERGGFLALPCQ